MGWSVRFVLAVSLRKGAELLRGLCHSSSPRWQNDRVLAVLVGRGLGSPVPGFSLHLHCRQQETGAAVALPGWKPPGVAIWISAQGVLRAGEALAVGMMPAC